MWGTNCAQIIHQFIWHSLVDKFINEKDEINMEVISHMDNLGSSEKTLVIITTKGTEHSVWESLNEYNELSKFHMLVLGCTYPLESKQALRYVGDFTRSIISNIPFKYIAVYKCVYKNTSKISNVLENLPSKRNVLERVYKYKVIRHPKYLRYVDRGVEFKAVSDYINAYNKIIALGLEIPLDFSLFSSYCSKNLVYIERKSCYWGLIIDEKSREKIKKIFKIPEAWKMHLNHVTISFESKVKVSPLQEYEVVVYAVGIIPGKVISISVYIPRLIGDDSISERPILHITVATSHDTPARLSNSISEWYRLRGPLVTLECELREVYVSNIETKRSF